MLRNAKLLHMSSINVPPSLNVCVILHFSFFLLLIKLIGNIYMFPIESHGEYRSERKQKRREGMWSFTFCETLCAHLLPLDLYLAR